MALLDRFLDAMKLNDDDEFDDDDFLDDEFDDDEDEVKPKNRFFKRFRDDDAPKMLDTIFANRCVDPSVIFNWDDCIQYYNRMLFGGQSVPAFMEANGELLETAMNQCIEELRAASNS